MPMMQLCNNVHFFYIYIIYLQGRGRVRLGLYAHWPCLHTDSERKPILFVYYYSNAVFKCRRYFVLTRFLNGLRLCWFSETYLMVSQLKYVTFRRPQLPNLCDVIVHINCQSQLKTRILLMVLVYT
jgi:hypothetical protein